MVDKKIDPHGSGESSLEKIPAKLIRAVEKL